MDECDARAVEAHARLLVDHFQTISSRFRNRLLDVAHRDRDVMQPWTALGKELADRSVRVLAQRLEELDLDVSRP